MIDKLSLHYFLFLIVEIEGIGVVYGFRAVCFLFCTFEVGRDGDPALFDEGAELYQKEVVVILFYEVEQFLLHI